MSFAFAVDDSFSLAAISLTDESVNELIAKLLSTLLVEEEDTIRVYFEFNCISTKTVNNNVYF